MAAVTRSLTTPRLPGTGAWLARDWRVVLARAAVLWVPLAVAITGMGMLVAVAVQQVIRSGANEPQVQLAEDAAAHLNAGAMPAAVLPAGEPVDMAHSLAPYVLVFDTGGRVVAGSATLHSQMPDYPTGVFAQTSRINRPGGYRVTWQPEPGVRSASVVVPWKGGFVVAGRSLRLEEERTGALYAVIAASWLVTVVGAAGACLVASFARSLVRN